MVAAGRERVEGELVTRWGALAVAVAVGERRVGAKVAWRI